ncbi:MAG TPA: transcriptional repressor [Gaiellales bacterium]|nr:transcriptional repressor [Gaiellales bacterium]
MDTGRNRRNRDALMTAAAGIDHAFSVRELHETARGAAPGIGLTTAYRAVDRWQRDGLVEQAGRRSGEAVYVLCSAGGHHHHLVCNECGAVTTLDGCALSPVRDAARVLGFQLDDQALQALPGRCARCAARAATG